MAGEGEELLFLGQQVTAPPAIIWHFQTQPPLTGSSKVQHGGPCMGHAVAPTTPHPWHRELDRDQGQAQGLGEDVMSSPMEKDSLDRTQES